MAAQQPDQDPESTTQDAEAFHGLHRVFRTGRNVAAGGWKQRGDDPLISSQQPKRDALSELAHEIKIQASDPGTSSFQTPVTCLLARELLLDHYESLANLVQQDAKVNRKNDFLRVDDYVDAATGKWPGLPHCFSQPPLHAIALDRSTQSPAYSEPDAHPRYASPGVAAGLALQIKDGNGPRKVPAA
jgi:hypothetical protein